MLTVGNATRYVDAITHTNASSHTHTHTHTLTCTHASPLDPHRLALENALKYGWRLNPVRVVGDLMTGRCVGGGGGMGGFGVGGGGVWGLLGWGEVEMGGAKGWRVAGGDR